MAKTRHLLLTVLLVAAAVLATPWSAWAQSDTGVIDGRVVDQIDPRKGEPGRDAQLLDHVIELRIVFFLDGFGAAHGQDRAGSGLVAEKGEKSADAKSHQGRHETGAWVRAGRVQGEDVDRDREEGQEPDHQ